MHIHNPKSTIYLYLYIPFVFREFIHNPKIYVYILYYGSIAHCINSSANREQRKKKKTKHSSIYSIFQANTRIARFNEHYIWKFNAYKTMSGSCKKNTTPVFITKKHGEGEKVIGKRKRCESKKCCMLKSQWCEYGIHTSIYDYCTL